MINDETVGVPAQSYGWHMTERKINILADMVLRKVHRLQVVGVKVTKFSERA